MHNMEAIVRKLGEIVYNNPNRMVDSQMVMLDIGGIKDEIDNKLHLVFYLQSGRELSSSTFVINKVYNEIFNDETYTERIDNFENLFDIDFMTLISYIYMIESQAIDTDAAISLTAKVIKVLYTYDQK